jgi:hypothetical protein
MGLGPATFHQNGHMIEDLVPRLFDRPQWEALRLLKWIETLVTVQFNLIKSDTSRGLSSAGPYETSANS